MMSCLEIDLTLLDMPYHIKDKHSSVKREIITIHFYTIVNNKENFTQCELPMPLSDYSSFSSIPNLHTLQLDCYFPLESNLLTSYSKP